MKFSELIQNASQNNFFAMLLGAAYRFPDIKNSSIVIKFEYRAGTKVKKVFKSEKDLNDLGIEWKNIITKLCKINNVDNLEIKETKHYSCLHGLVRIYIENDISKLRNKDLLGKDNRMFFIKNIHESVERFTPELKKSFFIGFINSAGSLDFSRDYISLDLDKKSPEICLKKLNFLNKIYTGNVNYNPRDNQPNSKSKNNQYRVNQSFFIKEYGFIIPFKVCYFNRVKSSNISIINLEN